jgi:hypothetical protein
MDLPFFIKVIAVSVIIFLDLFYNSLGELPILSRSTLCKFLFADSAVSCSICTAVAPQSHEATGVNFQASCTTARGFLAEWLVGPSRVIANIAHLLVVCHIVWSHSILGSYSIKFSGWELVPTRKL